MNSNYNSHKLKKKSYPTKNNEKISEYERINKARNLDIDSANVHHTRFSSSETRMGEKQQQNLNNLVIM